MLPAGIVVHRCIEVSCTSCADSYHPDEGAIHFPADGLEEALQAVTDAGWWVTTERGVMAVQCGPCAAREACRAVGHAWTAWKTCRCEGRILQHVVQMRIRICVGCHEFDEQPA